ncbi:MAG: hypothetical protein K9J06_08430 [Flavobacteriales bacterium]|nr:hypothetical protein [Flavobacteriales bacterium]
MNTLRTLIMDEMLRLRAMQPPGPPHTWPMDEQTMEWIDEALTFHAQLGHLKDTLALAQETYANLPQHGRRPQNGTGE